VYFVFGKVSAMEPTITVVVSTYNGALKLPVILEALARQTISNFELLIVVDGSTDNTLLVLDGYRHQFQSFAIISQTNSGRACVRNRGAQEASGTILIFYDDDMIPKEDSVQRHITIHQQHKKCAVSGNQVEFVERNKTDVQNYKATRVQRWLSKYKTGVTHLGKNNFFFTAANCSVSKALFVEMGGFNERLTDAEDFDFGMRVFNSGNNVFFDRDNTAIHNDRITARSYVNRLRQYQQASKKLAVINPEVARPARRSNFVKHSFYSLFAFSFWLRLMDGEQLLFLPNALRYKLYDVVLHSLSVEYPEVEI
jgi:glycosyltransferase involved in cell wall biosynthesis